MNILEAINIRKSRRTFLKTPIDEVKISVLKSQIQEYNGKSGLTMDFLEDGSSAFNGIRKSYGMFSGVRSLIILKGPKDDPDLMEKVGYYGERLILEATRFDLGTCWVGGTFDKSDIKVDDAEKLVCVVPIGNVPKEFSTKEQFIYALVHRKTKTIEQMLECDGDAPAWIMDGMAAVQKAPSTKNTQKPVFSYKGRILTASVPETETFDLLDLGIAKLHFELVANGRFELGNGGKFIPDKEV